MQVEPIYDLFARYGIEYQRCEHPAVFTCEEAERLVPEMDGVKTKNLFLRDRKGTRHFLVVVGYEKNVDLNTLSKVIGCSKLSLGSAERLADRLDVIPGSVTILALLNDADHQVELFLDTPIAEAHALCCHPLVNTATVSLTRPALDRFLSVTGHRPVVIDVPARE
ncbi:MAG: prolyl-tRNA synthetase associated domain-containing protein [Vulcanimicrobiota bacterium]